MHRQRSFKSKIIISITVSLLIAIIAMDAVCMILLYDTTIADAEKVVESIEDTNVERVNATLRDVTHSVEVLYKDALYTLGNDYSVLEDESFRQEYNTGIADIMYDVVGTTEGAVGVYLVYDQYATYSEDYIYYKKVGNDFAKSQMLEVSDFEASDFEHVGWYYSTISAGNATWIAPYYDENIGETVFSYTIPIYVNHVFVGLVGMDITVTYLQDIVSEMSAYETGYGFLLGTDNDIIYHPDYDMGEQFSELSESTKEQITSLNSNKYVTNTDILSIDGKNKWITYRTIENGMILGLSVFESEITAPVFVLFQRTLMITLVIILFTTVFVVQIIMAIARPLNELSAVAEKLGKGDMEVEISYYGTDEFGKLADAFRTMRNKLKESMDYMSGLAYSDIMTGTNNKGAFERDSMGITSNCQKSGEHFAVIVVDANDLKLINDRYGHAEGDELIKAVGFALMGVFGKRNTYRVGGDEFCVLLRENNSLRLEEDIRTFREALRVYQKEHMELFHKTITVAAGYSIFDPAKDLDFASVYQRADSCMYQDKKKMKETMNYS